MIDPKAITKLAVWSCKWVLDDCAIKASPHAHTQF